MGQYLPQNQINALPLAQISAANGGSAVILGGTVSRYWQPTDLGINAQLPVQYVSAEYLVVSGWLNVTGCTKFSLLIQRNATNNTGAPAAMSALPAMTGWLQQRMSETDTPNPALYITAGPNTGVAAAFVGRLQLNTASVVFPQSDSIIGGATVTQRAILSFSSTYLQAGGGGNAGPNNQANMLGSDFRLILSWSTNNPQNQASVVNNFTAAMWGAS